jgi:hypothetical protein
MQRGICDEGRIDSIPHRVHALREQAQVNQANLVLGCNGPDVYVVEPFFFLQLTGDKQSGCCIPQRWMPVIA